MTCTQIEDQDPDKLIKITVDYPEKKYDYEPFLNTEIRIGMDGSLDTCLYRKPQKKLLTLNANSHHPTSVKLNTVQNMYRTASSVSSNKINKQYSEHMVDELVTKNGYKRKTIEELKSLNNQKKSSNKHRPKNEKQAVLKIPFLSDQCTAKNKTSST